MIQQVHLFENYFPTSRCFAKKNLLSQLEIPTNLLHLKPSTVGAIKGSSISISVLVVVLIVVTY